MKKIKKWHLGCILGILVVAISILTISISNKNINETATTSSISNDIDNIETDYVKSSNEVDAGVVFKMTPENFITNYNKCMKNYGYEDYLPTFDKWMKTDEVEYEGFIMHYCEVNSVKYYIETTPTGDFSTFQGTNGSYMDFALIISSITSKTKETKDIYWNICDMMEEALATGKTISCLYVEGIAFTMNEDSTFLCSAVTEEAFKDRDINYWKLNLNDLYSERDILYVVRRAKDVYTGAEFDLKLTDAINIFGALTITLNDIKEFNVPMEQMNLGIDDEGLEGYSISCGDIWLVIINVNPNTGNVVGFKVLTKYDILNDNSVMENISWAIHTCINKEVTVDVLKDIYVSVHEQNQALVYKGTYTYTMDNEEWYLWGFSAEYQSQND